MSLVGALPKNRGVLSAELRRAQVADALAGATRVQILKQHESTSFVQPKHLLILERAHRRHGFEALMKRRRAHADRRRHLVDRDGLCEVLADPLTAWPIC